MGVRRGSLNVIRPHRKGFSVYSEWSSYECRGHEAIYCRHMRNVAEDNLSAKTT